MKEEKTEKGRNEGRKEVVKMRGFLLLQVAGRASTLHPAIATNTLRSSYFVPAIAAPGALFAFQRLKSDDVAAAKPSPKQQQPVKDSQEGESQKKKKGSTRFMADDFSKCFGCGSVLQSEEEHRAGYVPKETRLAKPVLPASSASSHPEEATGIVEKLQGRVYMGEKMFEKALKQSQRVVCQRCFSLQHYNKVIPLAIDPDDFTTQLKRIKWEHKALILMVVDILDFPGSFFPKFHELIGTDHPLVVVGNKTDLLPDHANHEKIRVWLAHQTRAILEKHQSLDVQVRLVSGKTGDGVKELGALISKWQHENTYLVGCTNVGKSQLLNSLLRHFGGDRSKVATASLLPGTTLRTIRFPLKGGLGLYDTPGVMKRDQLFTLLNQEELSLVVPSKRLKPVTYIVEVGRTLFLGGLARIEHLTGNGPVYFTVYVSNQLPIHVSADRKTEKLVADLRAGKSLILFPPTASEERMKNFPEYEAHDFALDGHDGSKSLVDLVISGLGWVSVTCYKGASNFRVHAPKGN